MKELQVCGSQNFNSLAMLQYHGEYVSFLVPFAIELLGLETHLNDLIICFSEVGKNIHYARNHIDEILFTIYLEKH